MSVVAPLPPIDPSLDVSKNHYWTYHSLPVLLACKKPLTASEDEDLFIAVHQICELAFHQMILDLDRALDAGAVALDGPEQPVGDTSEAVYFLNRVNQLWRTVNVTMPALAGLRAFAEFRTSIGPSSGFQSLQFRRIEIMSGVPTRYWEGGTADAEGRRHVAETHFDATFGAEIESWFERHRDHNLAAQAAALASRAPLADLHDHAMAGPFVRSLIEYDAAQLAFHKAHLGLAVTQLRKVGVEIGTGGTSFRSYLATYEKVCAPLFPGLADREKLTD